MYVCLAHIHSTLGELGGKHLSVPMSIHAYISVFIYIYISPLSKASIHPFLYLPLHQSIHPFHIIISLQAGDQEFDHGSGSMAVTNRPKWTQAPSSSASAFAQTSALALADNNGDSPPSPLLPPLHAAGNNSSHPKTTTSRSAAIRQKLHDIMAASVEKIAPVLFSNPLYKAPKAAAAVEGEGGKKKQKKKGRMIQSDNFKVNLNRGRLVGRYVGRWIGG